MVDSLDRPGDTPVAVVYHASWPDEKVLLGTLDDIAEKVEAAGISRSALILVGGVVRRTGFRRSHLYRRSVAVLVFPRDKEKGERIVQALAESYSPDSGPLREGEDGG